MSQDRDQDPFTSNVMAAAVVLGLLALAALLWSAFA